MTRSMSALAAAGEREAGVRAPRRPEIRRARIGRPARRGHSDEKQRWLAFLVWAVRHSLQDTPDLLCKIRPLLSVEPATSQCQPCQLFSVLRWPFTCRSINYILQHLIAQGCLHLIRKA